MASYPIPDNETERVEALQSYKILNTSPEEDFDELTALASEICKTPIALVSLIDEDRQWFKSNHGMSDTKETARELAFCAHTIVNENDVMVVNDARKDERFANNPIVKGEEKVVFYAGVPLVNPDGYALGSLCVIDHEPKNLTESQLKALRTLAKQVLAQMELRRKIATLQKANDELQEANAFIQRFATTAAHDIKNPLSSIVLTSQALQSRLDGKVDEKSRNLVDMTISSSQRLMAMVDDMLQYSTNPATLVTKQQPVDLEKLLNTVIGFINPPSDIKIHLPKVDHKLTCSAVALEQIFLNLIGNAVRYNDKEEGEINIKFSQDDKYYHFRVEDNGMGMAEKNLERIFHKDVTLNVTDRFNKKGTGIGLYTVRSLVEKLQGSIYAESRIGVGSSFNFSVQIGLSIDERAILAN